MTVYIFGLDICIPDMIWTIINFLLFFFLLKHFLFKPILDFMENRNAVIEGGLAEGRKAEELLRNTEKQMEEEVTATGSRARDIISDARSEAERKKGVVLEAAAVRADEIRLDINNRISGEEQVAAGDISQRMTGYVTLLSNRLLHSNEASEHQEMIQNCIDAAGKNIG